MKKLRSNEEKVYSSYCTIKPLFIRISEYALTFSLYDGCRCASIMCGWLCPLIVRWSVAYLTVDNSLVYKTSHFRGCICSMYRVCTTYIHSQSCCPFGTCYTHCVSAFWNVVLVCVTIMDWPLPEWVLHALNVLQLSITAVSLVVCLYVCFTLLLWDLFFSPLGSYMNMPARVEFIYALSWVLYALSGVYHSLPFYGVLYVYALFWGLIHFCPL